MAVEGTNLAREGPSQCVRARPEMLTDASSLVWLDRAVSQTLVHTELTWDLVRMQILNRRSGVGSEVPNF